MTVIASLLVAGLIAAVINRGFKPYEKQAQRALTRAFHDAGLPGEPPRAASTLWARTRLPPTYYLTALGYAAPYDPPPRTRPLGPHELSDDPRPVRLADPARSGALATTVVRSTHPLDPQAVAHAWALRADVAALTSRAADEPEVVAAAAALGEHRPRGLTAAEVRDAYVLGWGTALADQADDRRSPEPEVGPLWWQALACLALPAHPGLLPVLLCGYYHGRTGRPSASVIVG